MKKLLTLALAAVLALSLVACGGSGSIKDVYKRQDREHRSRALPLPYGRAEERCVFQRAAAQVFLRTSVEYGL